MAGGYICHDPTCCDPDYDLDYDQDANARRLAIVQQQQEAARLKREQKYRDHITSLPKLAGAVRMFRTWKLTASGDLKAMVANHTWKPGENVSLASGGDAKEDSGFYGFASLEELQRQERDWWDMSQAGEPNKNPIYDIHGRGVPSGTHWYICGTTLNYGHVKISEKGGRSQKAVPEYIIEPDGSDPSFGMLVVNAADKYGMQIITAQDAEELETGLVSWYPGRKN